MEARIIWHADLDPGTLPVSVRPTRIEDADALRIETIAPWLTVHADRRGREHAVLSDGWHHIRIDVEDGRLSGEDIVLLRYDVRGLRTAEVRLLPLRRLIDFCRRQRFARSLYPPDPRMDRSLLILRVHDALSAGASQREIAAALFGAGRVASDWADGSDSLRSRIRRLVRDARIMGRGGYRLLLGGKAES